MAYARLYHCQKLMLLYPCSPGERSGEVKRFGIEGGKEMLSISRIDMAMAPRNIEAALATIVGSLLHAPSDFAKTA